MANRFNPTTNVQSGSAYDFRGTDGNRALGSLIGNVADVADSAIKAGVRAVGHDIEQEAFKSEEQIQDNLFNTGDVAIAQASTTSGGQALPEDLNRGMKEALRLKQAYTKGALRESDYLANIDVLAKKMRSKYGAQWAPEIDAAIGAAMSNTANKFRKQLFSEWDAERDAALDHAKAMRSMIAQYPEHYVGYEDMWNNPENYSPAEHLGVIGPREKAKWEVTQLKAAAELADNQTKQGQDALARSLNAETSHFMNTFVDKAGTNFSKVLYEKIKTMGADDHFSKEEKDQLNQFLQAAQAQMLEGWQKISGQSMYGTLDPSKKAEAQAMITRQFEAWKAMVHDNATGVMLHDMNRIKAASQDQFFQWIESDPNLANATQAYMSLKEMGLGELAEEYFRQNVLQDSLDDAKAKGFTLFAQGLLGPDKLNRSIELIYNIPGGASSEAQKAALEALDLTVNTLTDDRTQTDERRRAGAALFNPNYQGRSFLTYYNDARGPDGQSPREKLYYRVLTPGTIAAMKSLKETDNTSWFNFYTWAVDDSFDTLLKQDFDQVLSDRGASGIKYDTQKQQFTQAGAKPDLRGSEDRQRVEQGRTDRKNIATEQALKRINFWIQRIRPVIESDSTTVDQELIRIFEARGYTNALELIPIEEDTGSEEGKKGQGSKGD
jgi:hypothetical protein